jgi:hypothetical protein
MHPESPGYGATRAKPRQEKRRTGFAKEMVDDQDGLLYFYRESQPLTTVPRLWRVERCRRLSARRCCYAIKDPHS